MQRCCTRKGGCVGGGVYVAMLYKKGGLCTRWCICSDVVQERGAVYVGLCMCRSICSDVVYARRVVYLLVYLLRSCTNKGVVYVLVYL